MAATPGIKLALVGGFALLLWSTLAVALRGRRAAPPVAPAAPAQVDAPPEPETPPPAAPASAAAPPWQDEPPPRTLDEQRSTLFRSMGAQLDINAAELVAVEQIIDASPVLGQGNPAISHHEMTRAECRAVRAAAGLTIEPHPPCDRKNMVPLYDPGAGQTAADAPVCIDQFEFPDIPCEYPVVYPTSREAALLCAAVGKRICDAHEWEGACAGALHAPEVEYDFGEPRPYATWLHNKHREVRWAYGPTKNHPLCATLWWKSSTCDGGTFSLCGTHSWPSGSFPACVSPFGVYDQHGNVAEHMNLPLAPDELASRGGTGATEMKGSWFIFAHEEPHEDDCRWRAKDWHPSALMEENSHRNYHLGFRCCKDVDVDTTPPQEL
jgi:sulfatase modifying factor 1